MIEEANQELSRYLSLLQRETENERLRRMAAENQLGETSAFNPIKEPNLVEYQLDLKEELDRIFHLLSGHIIVRDSLGNEKWEEPSDDRLKIFSEYGVKQIMNIVQFYVNRNTLLSFYDEDTIKWKVRDFGIELADLIFNRYEFFFYYPSPEELFEKYKVIAMNREIKISDEDLYQKCIQWSREELEAKCNHYPMMILAIVDTVDSTYRRALGGKERGSLRERINISQNTNTMNDSQIMSQQSQKRSFFSPKTW